MSVNNNISNQGCISQVQQLNGEVVPLNQQVTQGGEQLDAIAAQFRKNIPNPEPVIPLPLQQSKKVVIFLPPPPPKRIPSRQPKNAPPATSEQRLALTKALSDQGMYIAAEKAATEGITLEKKIRSPRPMILAELNLFLAASLYEQRKHSEVEKAATDGLNQERKLANPRRGILAGLNYYLDVSLTCQMKSPPPADPISSHQKILVDATLNLQLAYTRNDRGRHLEAEKAAKEGINEERKSATPRPNVLAELNSELAYSLYVQKEYLEGEKAASDGLNEERKVVTPRQVILDNLNKILQKAKEAQNLPMEPSATPAIEEFEKSIDLPPLPEANESKWALPAAPEIEEFEKSIELPPLPEVYEGSPHADDEKRSSNHPSEPMGFYPDSKRRKK